MQHLSSLSSTSDTNTSQRKSAATEKPIAVDDNATEWMILAGQCMDVVQGLVNRKCDAKTQSQGPHQDMVAVEVTKINFLEMWESIAG